MPIRDRNALLGAADDTLTREGPKLQQLLLIYLAIITGLSVAASLLTLVLSNRIADTGGLSGMGLRSVLSTVQSVLPLIQTVVMTGLQLGYCHAVLNARRGRYFSRDTLFGGFRRFIPLVCTYMLQGLLYAGLALVAMYLSTYIFRMLPVSSDFQALMAPLMGSVSALNDTIVLDEATILAASRAVLPVLGIFALVYIPLLLPTYYRYRMTMFRLIDHRRPRPLMAMRESRIMLFRNRFALLKLDLKLWWYYVLQLAILLVCYGDQILALWGVTLPWSADVSYLLFLGLSLALQFAVFWFAMNRVTLIYAAAYEELLAAFEERKTEMLEKMNITPDSPRNPWRDEF